MYRHLVRPALGLARKLGVALAGLLVLAVGVAMVLLPGPAILVVPLGVGILALEFDWARRWLRALEKGSDRLWRRVRRARTAM